MLNKFCCMHSSLYYVQLRKNHYKTLGIRDPRRATIHDIRGAYITLTKEHHPDAAQRKPNGRFDSTKFAQINEAYSVLSNKEKRIQYDKTVVTHLTYPSNFNNGNGFGMEKNKNHNYSNNDSDIRNLTRKWWNYQDSSQIKNDKTNYDNKSSATSEKRMKNQTYYESSAFDINETFYNDFNTFARKYNNNNNNNKNNDDNPYFPQTKSNEYLKNSFRKPTKNEKMNMKKKINHNHNNNNNSNNVHNSKFAQFWQEFRENSDSDNNNYNKDQMNNNNNTNGQTRYDYNYSNGNIQNQVDDSWTQYDEGSFWQFIHQQSANGKQGESNEKTREGDGDKKREREREVKQKQETENGKDAEKERKTFNNYNGSKMKVEETNGQIETELNGKMESEKTRNKLRHFWKFTENSDTSTSESLFTVDDDMELNTNKKKNGKKIKIEENVKNVKNIEESEDFESSDANMNRNDICVTINLSSIESRFGCTKEIDFLRNDLVSCDVCHGVSSDVCQKCHGKSKITKLKSKRLNVVMPGGVKNNDKVLVSSEGHEYFVSLYGGINGMNDMNDMNDMNEIDFGKSFQYDIEKRSNLWIVCKVNNIETIESMYELFYFKDNCIHTIVEIPFNIAMNGGIIDVPSIDSNYRIIDSKIRVLPGTMSGDYKVERIMMNGYGINNDNDNDNDKHDAIDYEYYHFQVKNNNKNSKNSKDNKKETKNASDGIVTFEKPKTIKNFEMIETNRINHQRNKKLGRFRLNGSRKSSHGRHMPLEYDSTHIKNGNNKGNNNIVDLDSLDLDLFDFEFDDDEDSYYGNDKNDFSDDECDFF